MKQISHSLKILPLLVCRKDIMYEEKFKERLKELKENFKVEAQILKGIIINEESHFALLKESVKRADVILLYKPYLGLEKCVIKVADYGIPIILFREPYKIHSALDALEYIWNKKNVWIAIDYQDMNSRLELLRVCKELEDTRVLVLNSDYPHWEKWLLHVFGGIEAIKERFGIEVEYVESGDMLERWKTMQNERVRAVAKEWMKHAEKIIEPEEEDVMAVARLYLVIKDLLQERQAQAVTMAYGDNPFPVPCFAYTNLRDEGIPAGCEADILSLLTMVIIHYLADKPSFMGGDNRTRTR